MVKRRDSCMICGHETIHMGNCYSFQPILCCGTRNVRKVSHRRRSK